jgi:WD40 repeat protein/serine/threonine protein kinase
VDAHLRAGSFLESPAAELRALTQPGSPKAGGEGQAERGIATIDEPLIAERPGTVIGPYKLMEQIGEGGMGLVFVAEQQHPVRRKVALKVIKPGMDTRQVIARFEAERQALALMDHPNIAKVLDGGETASGRPYFVMELVKGVPITDYCDQNQVPIRERLELFLSVCQAVQHAHQKGIIHRDLKPSNVLVMSNDGQPVVRVIDFGVAKAVGQQLTDKTIYTQFTQLIGTPLYMSPEQAGQSSLDADTRSDIYSLGVLLYELLTGTTPFDKERLRTVAYDEMRRIILEEEPPRPSTRMTTQGQAASTASVNRKSDPHRLSQLFRGELDWIVMKCLEKDRNRRYETANSLASDIQRYLHDEPVQACPPSGAYRLRKFARRNKGAMTTAALLTGALVITVVGLAISNLLVINERNQKTQALGDREMALGNERAARSDLEKANVDLEINLYHQTVALAERHLSAGSTGLAERLLNSQQCPPAMRGWEWHYLKGLCRGSVPTLRAQSILFCLALSRDGHRLAAGGNDGSVTFWDTHTWQARRFDAHRGRVSGLAFSDEGRRLWSAGSDGAAHLWDASTGQRLTSLGGGRDEINDLALSPNGRLVALARETRVDVWEAPTGRRLVDLGIPDAPIGDPVVFSPNGQFLVTGCGDRDLAIWDTSTWQRQFTLRGHGGGLVETAVFSLDGRLLASGCRRIWDDSDASDVIIWDLDNRRPLHTLRGLGGGSTSLAFSPDGLRLATGGCEDPTIKIWDVLSGKETLTLRGHHETIFGLAFSPDGHRLYSASADHTVRVWDGTPAERRTSSELQILRGHEGRVNSLAFSHDGRSLVSGGMDRTARLWDINTGRERRTLIKGASPVYAVAFSPDGASLAMGSFCAFQGPPERPELRIWDARLWQERLCLALPNEDGGGLTSLAFSPDSRRLVMTTNFHPTLVDVTTGLPLLNLRASKRLVRAVVYGTKRGIAWGGLDGDVMIWDESITQYATPAVASILPGSWLVRLVGARMAFEVSPTYVLRAHTSRAVSVGFSPDQRRLASSGIDGLIKVWEHDGQQWFERLSLRGHLGAVHAVAFSPKGRQLASAGQDGSVRVWDAESGRELAILRGHTDCAYTLAYSPDGRYLASGSSDGTIRVWDAGTWAVANKEQR